MRLSVLLKLQLAYAATGAGFNAVSLLAGALGMKALTPTNPYLGLMVMLVYASFLLTAYKGHLALYRLLMVCALLLFGYSGVYVHIVQMHQQPELYYSSGIAITAIVINVFGWLLNFIAALGCFNCKNPASPRSGN